MAMVEEPPVPTANDLQKIRNEEFKVWKRQSPFLYDVCMTRALSGPATSLQWLPSSSDQSKVPGFQTSQALVTEAGPNSKPRAYIADCDLPDLSSTAQTRENTDVDALRVFEPSSDPALTALDLPELPLIARCSPKDPKVASIGMRGGLAAIARFGPLDTGSERVQQLKYHTKDVFSVSWAFEDFQFATVSADGSACLWDAETCAKRALGDRRALAGETKPAIYAVQYAPKTRYELATAGDDRTIRFWDSRNPGKPVRSITDAHASAVTALDYSLFNEHLVATGSADGAVAVWDSRMSSASLVGLQASTETVSKVSFSPHEASVFATGAGDGHVRVWDFSMHGFGLKNPADESEGPSELLFLHGGHLGPVTDISWHPTWNWTLASAAEDSLVQVWQIADKIVNTDLADVDG